MPRWDFNLIVSNETDRELKLVEYDIPWGKKGQIPNTVKANTVEKFNIYQAAGVAAGYEFNLAFQDVCVQAGQTHYGTVSIHVDVPLSKSNSASLSTTGILNASGWNGSLPKSGHDFSKTLIITKKNV